MKFPKLDPCSVIIFELTSISWVVAWLVYNLLTAAKQNTPPCSTNCVLQETGGCVFSWDVNSEPRAGRKKKMALLHLMFGQTILGCWLIQRNKMHDCGLGVFMLKHLVPAHLRAEHARSSPVSISGGFRMVWCMQRDVCTAWIEGPSIGGFKPAKYTTSVWNPNRFVFAKGGDSYF